MRRQKRHISPPHCVAGVGDIEEVIVEKACKNCSWLKRFTAKDDSWMDVCTSQEPDEETEGLYTVYIVDQSEFDASLCLNFTVANECLAPLAGLCVKVQVCTSPHEPKKERE